MDSQEQEGSEILINAVIPFALNFMRFINSPPTSRSFEDIVVENVEKWAASVGTEDVSRSLNSPATLSTCLHDIIVSVLRRHEQKYVNHVAALLMNVLVDVKRNAWKPVQIEKREPAEVSVHWFLQEMILSMREWFHSRQLTLSDYHPLLADNERPPYFLSEVKKSAFLQEMKSFMEQDDLPETHILEFEEVRIFLIERINSISMVKPSRLLVATQFLQTQNYHVEQSPNSNSDKMLLVTSATDNQLYKAQIFTSKCQIEQNQLLHVRHDYLEQFKWVADEEQQLYIRLIRHYPAGCNLDAFIAKCRLDGHPIQEHQILSYSKQIALGLAFIHDHNCVHGHISPQTIVMETDSHLRICALSTVQPFVGDDSIIEVNVQEFDPRYTAPEVLNSPGFLTAASDSWSLGCVLFDTVTMAPFGYNEDYEKVLHQYRRVYSEEFLRAVASLLKKMWIVDEKERPTLNKLLKEEILREATCPETTESTELHLVTLQPEMDEIGHGAGGIVRQTGPDTVTKFPNQNTKGMLHNEVNLRISYKYVFNLHSNNY